MSVELTTAPHCLCILSPLNARHERLTVRLGPADKFRFGRRPGLEVSFPRDFRISSLHCTLLLGDGGLAVEDSSSNGTFVNGERVPQHTRRMLNSGDQLFLVIPNNSLLQSGYSGSLTQNYVGYVVDVTWPPSAAPTAPATIAPALAADARGSLPPPAPGAPSERPAAATPAPIPAPRPSEIPTVRTTGREPHDLLLQRAEPSSGAEHHEGSPAGTGLEQSAQAARGHSKPRNCERERDHEHDPADLLSFAAWSLVNMTPEARRQVGAPSAASSVMEPLPECCRAARRWSDNCGTYT